MKNTYKVLISFFLILLAQGAFAQDPIVYLPLDADLNDASGNGLNATDAGTEPTEFVEDGQRGTVAKFPVAAHAQLPLDPKLDFGTEDFSVAFWVKIDNTVIPGGDPVIVGNKDWGSGGNTGFLVALDGANDATSHLWTVNTSDGAGGRLDWDADDNATPNLVDNQWHFVAVTFDRDATMNVYLDGELRQSDPSDDSKNLTLAPGDMAPDDLPFTIMQDATGGYGDDFEAMLDDILIYDYVLSAEEITGLNENGYTINPSLGADVYLPFDGDLNDASGNELHATDAGTAPTEFVEDSERGMVAKFSVAAHAQLPLDPSLDFGTNDFSVAFWVKIDNTVIPGGDPVIVGNKDWGSGGNTGFLVALDGANDATSHLWTVNTSDGAGGRLDWDADDNATPNLVDNQWHFVAVTFDRDATMNVYLDGELRQSDPSDDSKNLTLAPGDMAPDDLPFTIMQDATGGYGDDFEAMLDDVRVWAGKALSAEEIADAYNFTIEQPVDETYGADIYLPLDADLNDATGNGVNATDAGSEPTAFVEDADRGTVAEFPVAAHAQFPQDNPLLDFGTDNFSVSFWIKIDPNIAIGGDPSIFSNKDWGSGGNPGFLIALDGADDPSAHLWTVNVADGANGRIDWDADDNATPNLKDGHWHFVAVAFDRSSTMNVYFDGELRQSDEADDSKNLTLVPGSLTSEFPLTIMQDGTGGYGDDFAARLDNIRIWKGKVISDEEVATIFEEDKGNGDGGGGEIVLGNSLLEDEPETFKIYPNPVVNHQAIITYQLSLPSEVNISIYNRIGQLVQTLHNESHGAGEHTINWDTSAYQPGIYYYRLEGTHIQKFGRVIISR